MTDPKSLERVRCEQRRCRDWLAEQVEDSSEVVMCRLGLADWVMEEVLIAEEIPA